MMPRRGTIWVCFAVLGIAGWQGCEFLNVGGLDDNDPIPPEIHGCFYDYECGDGFYCADDRQCHEPVQSCVTSKLGCREGDNVGCLRDDECTSSQYCESGICNDLPVVLDPCSAWSGPTSGGNDPDSVFRMEICRDDAGNITGKSTTSSPRSGFSERVLAGRILNEERLELEMWETAITVDQPNAGWRFCTADRYELRLRDEKLVGTFVSKECNDDGWVLLNLE